jgi:iron complex outermembrane recepter protein
MSLYRSSNGRASLRSRVSVRSPLPATVLSPAAAAVMGLTLSLSAHAQQADADTTATLPTATVVADRSGEAARVERVSSGALGDRKAVDTPFSVNAVSSDEIQQRMAQTANDVFKYDPAVQVLGDNARTENSYFAVRGIRVDMLNGTKVDGQNFVTWDADIPLEPFEQVELLKGLSGFMYGFGSPGGIINYVTKRPTDKPFREVTVGYQTNNVWSEKVDVGGRFGNDDRFGYRINAVNEDGNTNEPGVHVRRQTFSLATDFRITPDLTWNADIMYWKRKSQGTIFGLSFGTDTIPAASSVARNLAQPWSSHETDTLTVGTGVDYRINSDWKTSFKYRFARQNRLNADSFLFVSDDAGNYSDTNYRWKTAYYYQAYDAMVQGKFDTGGLKHEVVAGLGYLSQVRELDNGLGSNGIPMGMNNLYNPVALPEQPGVGKDYIPYRDYRIQQKSVYLSDTVQITPRLSVLAGLRYNMFSQDNYNPDAVRTSRYSANPITPTVAVMFKTDDFSTAYVSYVESLEPGGSAGPTAANFGETFGPLKSRQYEVGFKTDRDKWGANVALFRVDKGYEYTNTSNVFVQNGKQQFTGVDTSGWWRVARDVRLMGGVLWLHTKTRDVDDPLVNGNRVFATPNYIVTGRVEYDTPFVPGLTLWTGAKVTGAMYVNSANTQQIPSYTTADVGARYTTRVAGKQVTVRAVLNNVFNRRYWTTTYDGFVLPAATRTFLMNASLQF